MATRDDQPSFLPQNCPAGVGATNIEAMVRRKAATSSTAAVTVYRDKQSLLDSDDEDDDVASPPPKKKTRLSTVTAAVPKTRRAALTEKATNPSSSDNSFLRPIEHHESFHEKPQKVKKKALPESETITNSVTKALSSLREGSIVESLAHRALREQLPAKDLEDILSLMRNDAAQEAADLIAKKGCWLPDILNCFRASGLISLDLSSPSSPAGVFIPHVPPGLTLRVLFQQHQFSALAVITFRNTPLLNDDLASLRLLSSLEDIDISNTGVGTQSLHHLVCHRHTLKKLNLSHNSAIEDDSRVALSAFPRLSALYLRGTSFTMPGLRCLVLNDLNQSCRLLSIPAHCIDYLNTRKERYMVDIPTGYVQDTTQVAAMTMPNLKKNLELHSKVNKDVQVTGTKVELVNRLGVILSNRAADLRIVEVLGRA